MLVTDLLGVIIDSIGVMHVLLKRSTSDKPEYLQEQTLGAASGN